MSNETVDSAMSSSQSPTVSASTVPSCSIDNSSKSSHSSNDSRSTSSTSNLDTTNSCTDNELAQNSSSTNFNKEKKSLTNSKGFERVFDRRNSSTDDNTQNSVNSENSSDKGPKTEFKEEFNIRPFQYIPTDLLKLKRQQIVNDIKSYFTKEGKIASEIDTIINEELPMVSYGDQRRSLKRQLNQMEVDKSICVEKRKELEEESKTIGEELEKREGDDKSFDTSSSFQVSTLYRQGDLAEDRIVNIMLYTATFFQDLPINDFKGVILELLGEETGKIEHKFINKIKSSDDKILPIFSNISLKKYWDDNRHRIDDFLAACLLEPKQRENGFQIIDFSSENIRENLYEYFKEKKSSFYDERINQAEVLLFYPSRRVAIQVTLLLAESARVRDSDWLLEIARKAPDKEYSYDRIAELMYQIQIRLTRDDSKFVLIPFFRALLDVNTQIAITTIFHLLYRHLSSRLASNILNVPELLKWLKEIVDSNDAEQQKVAEECIWWLLNQDDSENYLYDFLNLLYVWLPHTELEEEEYETSHKLALEILSEYCIKTLNDFPDKDYGKWDSKYILFKPLSDEKKRLNNINMLVRWLFYRDSQKQLLIDDSTSNQFFTIAFIISEWFSILYGLKKDDKLNPQAGDFAKEILKQIIEVTDRSIQKRLIEYWSMLTDYFLDVAEDYDREQNTSQRKKFSVRRIRTKELKKIFKELQQEAQKEESK